MKLNNKTIIFPNIPMEERTKNPKTKSFANDATLVDIRRRRF